MKLRLVTLLFFISFSGLSQKQVEKTILDPSITLIQIDAENCFEVVLETTDTAEIQIAAQMEGEYSKDLELTMHEDGTTLILGAGFRSDFINPNDKLSAHKVVSIGLHIVVPKWKNVEIFGTNSRVLASGVYSNLDIVLSDGLCKLHDISKLVKVKTQSGNIFVSTKSGEIKAHSKYGKITRERVPIGDNQYILSTVTGNIEVSKLEY